MDTAAIIGFALLLAGAACGGSFGLPSKFVPKNTPWETLWGPFFLFVTILLPITVFPLIADGLFTTCREVGWSVVMLPVIFGFLWGLGSMTLGLSFAFIGLSLAYAINYGAQIAVGGMGPFVLHHPEQLLTSHGMVIMAGVLVCIFGVIVCGRAGILKSRSQQRETQTHAEPAKGPSIGKGLLLAFASGVLCACWAIAFSYGGKVMAHSEQVMGNSPWRTAFVVTALVLWGGSLSACGYCVYKFCKQKTWGTLAGPGIVRVLLIALVMAMLHDGAVLLYGVGASKLGTLGGAIGYAAFMSFAIIVGNINGFLTGEWKGAGKQSAGWIVAGIAVLVIGVSVLAGGNYMQKQYEAEHNNANIPEHIQSLQPTAE